MSGQRVHERHTVELPVTIIHEGESYVGTTQNLSLGGTFVAFAQAPEALPLSAKVEVALRLPAIENEVRVPSVVRWTRDDGVGLQFMSLRALEVWALNQLFQKQGA